MTVLVEVVGTVAPLMSEGIVDSKGIVGSAKGIEGSEVPVDGEGAMVMVITNVRVWWVMTVETVCSVSQWVHQIEWEWRRWDGLPRDEGNVLE